MTYACADCAICARMRGPPQPHVQGYWWSVLSWNSTQRCLHRPARLQARCSATSVSASGPHMIEPVHGRVMTIHTLILVVVCACVAGLAWPTAADVCTSADAPSHREISKLLFIAPPAVAQKLNATSMSAAIGSPQTEAGTDRSDCSSANRNKQGLSSPASQPVLTSTKPVQDLPSSHDLLTTLSLVVLVNNLMPRPLPPTWALATTTAAWLWLAFRRLQSWLPQTIPPSRAATATTAASGADAVAAAAGLSSAATAAGAAAGVGGDPSTRWWQHGLLVLELLWGNAVDAVLLMGLLLLPVIAFRRWRAGKSIWGSALPSAAASRTASALPADSTGLPAPETLATPQAYRRSFEGVSAQLQSAGHTAARLAKAMHQLANKARRSRGSASSSSGGSTVSTSSSNDNMVSNLHAAHSPAAASSTSSSTGSMVSPEHSALQPNTPPLLFVSRHDGPLTSAGHHMRLAQPLQASPTQEEITAGREAAAKAVATETGRYDASNSNTTATGSSSGSTAQRSTTKTRPDYTSGQQQHDVAASPSGSRTDSGSSAPAATSLNLGAVGTIRTASARGPMPPMYPTRALYTSPLQTVVISCKLSTTTTTSSALQGRQSTTYAAPGPQSPRMTLSAAADARGTTHSEEYSVGVQVPLSPTQASLAVGGSGSSISAQRELMAVVEAAVRQAIAASNVAVLSTAVTSFPGCVHVVTTANLAAAFATAAESPAESAVQPSAAATGTAAAVGDLESPAAKVAWQHVVQEIIDASQPSAIRSSSSSQAGAAVLAREGLSLKHILVQNTAGNIHYLWVAPDAAAEVEGSSSTVVGPVNESVQSGSVYSEPTSPTASTSSSRISRPASTYSGLYSQLVSAASRISISSFALPTDDAADADRPPASRLLLPAQLAETLASVNAGLRVVISANPSSLTTAAPHASNVSRSRSSSPASSRDSLPANLFTIGNSSSIHHSNMHGSNTHEHLLVDHTLWPNTSSWPSGAEFDLLQLLPATLPAAVLARQFGPVLTVNLVASTRRLSEADDSFAAAVAATPAAAAAGGDSAADVVHSTLASGVPDAAPVHHEQPTMQRTPSAAEQLHTDISSLLKRLKAGEGATSPTAGVCTPTAAVQSEHVVHTGSEAGAVTAGSVTKQQPLGECLLLQLPLLLLPSAACNELDLLQQRMVGELGGDAVAASCQHMLPLINDIAAALNMCNSSSLSASSPPCGPAAAPAAGSLNDLAATAADNAAPSCLLQSHSSAPAASPPPAPPGPLAGLTGVCALIAQQEMMAAAAANAAMSPHAVLSPPGSGSSTSVLSPRGTGAFVLARSPSQRRSGPPSPAVSFSGSTAGGRGNHNAAGTPSSPGTALPFSPPQPQPQQQQQQPPAEVELSVHQKHLLKQILQFMSDQSLDALAATLCRYVGVGDVRQLLPAGQLQHSTSTSTAAPAATGGRPSMGMSEIEPDDERTPTTFTSGGTSTAAAASFETLAPQAEAAGCYISAWDAAPADTIGSPGSEHGVQQDSTGPSSSSATTAASGQPSASLAGKDAANVAKQASAAHEQAVAAQRAAAATGAALQLALQQINALSAATAAANRQAAQAVATAAAASQRATAVEQRAERERVLQLIGNPAGAPAAGVRGVGIWGLLSCMSWATAAARAGSTSLLGGTINAAEPPVVPAAVTPRDVLLGFQDERLEVQYRRLKALQCRTIDRAALLMQLFRQVVYVWRIARLMFVSAGTGLSLVLLCKYEAVVLLPYVMMVLTPDFYIYHRHLLLCLSHIAAALTVGMISATEVYRNEWSALLQHPGPTLLARPSMMLAWYYLLVPLLQQQTLPEQAITCVAQLVHSLLIYVFILKGMGSLVWVVPLLLAASGLSFGVSYVADVVTRQQAVEAARRSLTG